MSYTELPPGPLPLRCTQCGSRMRIRETRMLPRDPQTGVGTPWRVIECPLHDNGNWGTKHHYDWWRSWYHDAFMIEPVSEGESRAQEGESAWVLPLRLLGMWMIVLVVTMVLVGMARLVFSPPM